MDLSNENIVHIKKEGIEYLQFKRLLEYSSLVTHAYILGKDKNFRTGLANNQKLSDEDYNKAVKSYKLICQELNINYEDIIKPMQNHTDNVECVKNKKSICPDFESYEQTDGLITNKSNLALSTTNADCILLLFFDPIKKVIANVHSGWKGTLKRISIRAVEKMKQIYNCNTKDIICCICPSIRKCHFEVGEDVYSLFVNEFKDLNLDKIIEKRKEKWYIDTVLINEILLENIGIKEKNIIDCNICSVCNSDLMHSYRVEGATYGLSSAIIELK